jgi:hypothetical protein
MHAARRPFTHTHACHRDVQSQLKNMYAWLISYSVIVVNIIHLEDLASNSMCVDLCVCIYNSYHPTP